MLHAASRNPSTAEGAQRRPWARRTKIPCVATCEVLLRGCAAEAGWSSWDRGCRSRGGMSFSGFAPDTEVQVEMRRLPGITQFGGDC